MPNMICLAGMPGVGKTTWARNFLMRHSDYFYFNPDEYYKRINGVDTDRTNTFEVWHAMFRDIYIAMKDGKNVLVDSDNLTFHQRTQWVEWFPDFVHVLVFFEEPYEVCYARMMKRQRKLSYGAMITKWSKWQRPTMETDGNFWQHIYKGAHSLKEEAHENE